MAQSQAEYAPKKGSRCTTEQNNQGFESEGLGVWLATDRLV